MIDEEMIGKLSSEAALESRNHIGGSGSLAVNKAILKARNWVENDDI